MADLARIKQLFSELDEQGQNELLDGLGDDDLVKLTASSQPPRTPSTFQKVEAALKVMPTRDAQMVRGLVRGVKDIGESARQLITRGGPGEVFGERAFMMGRTAEETSPERAVQVLEQFQNRKLSEAERANVMTRPAEALEFLRLRMNRDALSGRREFTEKAPLAAQVSRFAPSFAIASRIRTPAAIAQKAGLGGFAARAGFGGAAGTGFGAAQFVLPDTTRSLNAAIGGAFGLLTTGAIEGVRQLLPAKALANRASIREVLDEPGRGKFIADTKALEREIPGIKFSAAGRGLGESVSQAEREIAGSRQVTSAQFRERNTNALINNIRQTIAGKPNLGAGLAKETSGAIDKIRSTRATDFSEAIEEAINVDGGKKLIGVNPIKEPLLERIRELRRIKKRGAGDRAELSGLISVVRRLKKQNIDTRTAQSLMEEFSDKAFAKTGVFGSLESAPVENGARRAAQKALAAFEKTLADSSEGGKRLIAARKEFADVSQALREIQATKFGTVLNTLTKKGAPISQDRVRAAWRLSTPEEQTVVLRAIGNNERVLPTLRKEWLDDLIEKSRLELKAAPGRDTVDLDALLANWKADDKFQLLFRNKPDMLRRMIRARQALDRLAPRGPSKAGQGQVGGQVELVRSTAGLAGGQPGSQLFLAGLISRRLFPKTIERLLTTDKGIDSLIKAASPRSFNAAEVTAAELHLKKIFEETQLPEEQ